MPPGTQLTFRDTPQVTPATRRVTVETVPARLSQQQGLGGSTYELSPEYLINHPKVLERWSQLEGWTPQAGIDFFNRYGTGYQFQYRPIG